MPARAPGSASTLILCLALAGCVDAAPVSLDLPDGVAVWGQVMLREGQWAGGTALVGREGSHTVAAAEADQSFAVGYSAEQLAALDIDPEAIAELGALVRIEGCEVDLPDPVWIVETTGGRVVEADTSVIPRLGLEGIQIECEDADAETIALDLRGCGTSWCSREFDALDDCRYSIDLSTCMLDNQRFVLDRRSGVCLEQDEAGWASNPAETPLNLPDSRCLGAVYLHRIEDVELDVERVSFAEQLPEPLPDDWTGERPLLDREIRSLFDRQAWHISDMLVDRDQIVLAYSRGAVSGCSQTAPRGRFVFIRESGGRLEATTSMAPACVKKLAADPVADGDFWAFRLDPYQAEQRPGSIMISRHDSNGTLTSSMTWQSPEDIQIGSADGLFFSAEGLVALFGLNLQVEDESQQRAMALLIDPRGPSVLRDYLWTPTETGEQRVDLRGPALAGDQRTFVAFDAADDSLVFSRVSAVPQYDWEIARGGGLREVGSASIFIDEDRGWMLGVENPQGGFTFEFDPACDFDSTNCIVRQAHDFIENHSPRSIVRWDEDTYLVAQLVDRNGRLVSIARWVSWSEERYGSRRAHIADSIVGQMARVEVPGSSLGPVGTIFISLPEEGAVLRRLPD